MKDNLRLFFAIEVPEEIKADLGKFGVTLERPWRPVKTDLMHITLAFMGEVPAAEIDRVKKIGQQAAEKVARFNMEISDTSVFPETGDPKVLYAQAGGGETLINLVDALRAELGELADQKKFKAHLTLARSRGERARKIIRKFRGNWKVEEFALFKSTLTEDAPQHELIERFKLVP